MPDDPKRVVITGVGAVSAAGPTAPDFWSALLDGRCCITPLEGPGIPRPAVAGQIADYGGPAGVPETFASCLSRSAQLALDAAIQAIADSRITFNAENAFDVAAVIGTAHGSGVGAAAGRSFFSSGLSGSATGLNIAGPVFTINADGASGLAAILHGAQLIRSGTASVAVVGGADAPLAADVWSAYESAGWLSSQLNPEAHRPFDLLRDGMVLGEGAAVLVLEDRALAAARGARVYAEIAGGALTSGPLGDGMAPTDVTIARRALGNALRDADRSPHEIDIVFAAGLGTKQGDQRETDILERAFGARILGMYVTAASPVIGYVAGASGAFSAVAAALAVSEQIVPPHATYAEPDPDCALDINRKAQRDNVYSAAVCAYGAAGQSAALLITAHQAEPGDEIPTV